jgi:hypothetical protein
MTTGTALRRALAGAGLLLLLASPAPAQAPAGSKWHFSSTPIGVWAMGIKGTATVHNITRDMDVGFDELFDHLQGSFAMHFTATKGRVGGYLDLSYFKVGEDDVVAGNASPADVWIKVYGLEGGVTYDFVASPEVGLTSWIGLRYSGIKGGIEANDGSIDVESKTTDWYDPLIGSQVTKPIGSGFALALKGDVGGFSISEHTSELTWTIWPFATYRFPISGGKRSLMFSAGYRYTSIDFEGEGPSVFQMDADVSGPTFGFSILF